MERQKFEDRWQDAFKDAEQAVPGQVWTNVEQQLIQAESGTMKRKVVYYQRLAAASVLLALAFGAVATYYAGFYDGKISGEKQLTTTQKGNTGGNDGIQKAGTGADAVNPDSSTYEVTRRSLEENTTSENGQLANNGSGDEKNGQHQLLARENQNDEVITARQEKVGNRRGADNTVTKQNKPDGRNNTILLTENDQQEENGTEKALTRRSIAYNGLAPLKDRPEEDAQVKGKPRVVEIARRLPAISSAFMKDSKKEKNKEEQLWASLGASAGNYSPHVNADVSAERSFNAPSSSAALPQNSSSSSSISPKGNAYSFGLNIGAKVSRRWLIQGGVAYMNQAVGYTSNFAAIDQNNKAVAYVSDYAQRTEYSNTLSTATPYEINSVNEFVSIPVQAGYLLLDRKFGIQINSGIATDFFLQNTLTDKSGRFEKFSENAGEESPYRSVSWSGLMGTEFSYKLGSQYRVSLAPGIRYSFGSVLKSGASNNPMVWDMGFRFRYIFK